MALEFSTLHQILELGKFIGSKEILISANKKCLVRLRKCQGSDRSPEIMHFGHNLLIFKRNQEQISLKTNTQQLHIVQLSKQKLLWLLLLPDLLIDKHILWLIIPIIEYIDSRAIIQSYPFFHRCHILYHCEGICQVLVRQWDIYFVFIVVLFGPER